MRDLSSEEMVHVYGAGGRSKSPCPPRKQSGSKSRRSKGGTTGRYGRGSRHGKGGSS